MTYRPDIDGLRAVAVIAVILFHLNAAWLPGGFLGVDIFFVISGYLIGGILYRELSTNTFSLKRFYLRRMRRILPAFFAVVVFTLIVGAQLMVPGSDEWNTARSSAKWSVFFGGNFFSALNTDYFAPTVEVQPLNHLWSLAVEEQFYFIYPLILWAIMGIIKRILPPASSSLTRCVNVVLTALAIASFALAFLPMSLHGTALVPYYLPHLRFGELLIGAILAVAVAQGNLQPSAKTATFVGSLSILVLIACLVLPFPNTTPWFPGFAAALPCIASAGIIYAGARPYWFASALSHRAVVFVGKISYSLYLWHWPLLAFAHYALGRELSNTVLAATALLIVLLSLASYYLIEQPLRHLQWSFGRTGLVYYLLPTLLVAGLYMQGRTTPDEMRPYVQRGSLNVGELNFAYKTIGDSLAENNILIIGNSYTIQLHDFFDKVAKHEGWKATFSGVSAHFPNFTTKVQSISAQDYARELPHVGQKGEEKKELDLLRTRRIAGELNQYNTVIISLNWWHEEFLEKALQRVEKNIARFQKEGKQVILVHSCYTYNTYRVAETYHKVMGKGNGLAYVLPTPILQNENYTKALNNFQKVKQTISTRYPQVRWVDLTLFLPSDLMVDGKTVLCNGTHINIYGANYLADRFIESGQHLITPVPSSHSR
ncbi:acyltransferase family protein [Ihuprevotella massiliensis]|uniref:acyltransferase family protein n=1 Tax=Ihuprevotella massiliensis TaxID=1852368 RepID=UPI00094E6D11